MKPSAYWILRNGQTIGLVIPDTYGKPHTFGLADIMGRWTVNQIKAMKVDLPSFEIN